MATLTISLDGNGNYCVAEPEPITVPFDGDLVITVPGDGCLLCFDKDFKGNKRLSITETTTICMKGEPHRRAWTYDIVAFDGACRKETILLGAHSVQIGD
jgi:hypothetical protein